MPYRLIAFDFDGTLADSLDSFLAALSEASRLHGFRDATPDLRPALRGMSARDIIRALDVPMWKVPRVTIDMRRLMPRVAQVALFPGVDETFDALAARGIRIAIATSNTEAIVRDGSARTPAAVSSISHGIPLFGKARRLRALVHEAGVRSDEVLYVGDEIRDADAARRARIAFQGVALHRAGRVAGALRDTVAAASRRIARSRVMRALRASGSPIVRCARHRTTQPHDDEKPMTPTCIPHASCTQNCRRRTRNRYALPVGVLAHRFVLPSVTQTTAVAPATGSLS